MSAICEFMAEVEEMLCTKGDDWESIYLPDVEAHVIKYKGIEIGIFELDKED